MTNVYLSQFQIIKPKYCVPQSELLSWITSCHQASETGANEVIEKLFQRYAVKSSQISQRYLECDDVFSKQFSENKIYRVDSSRTNGVSIGERAQFFSDRAYDVFNKFYDVKDYLPRPNHIIHVSCTGYVSPSAAQRIVTEEKWNQITDITHAYHMGCYAAMPAVRIAKSLVLAEAVPFTADIVHTEMCGLHLNPAEHSPEQMVVQTLFADGHIKYTASTQLKHGKSLKVIAMLEKVVPNSQQDMSWIPAPWGMQMNLSREVPAKIKAELKNFSNELFKKANLGIKEALKSVFAIHPGGPKIIDSVQAVLELSNEQISESKKVLFERGNMSSATLPHVWSEILDHDYAVGTKVISYAFGPGLTLFGSVFEVC